MKSYKFSVAAVISLFAAPSLRAAGVIKPAAAQYMRVNLRESFASPNPDIALREIIPALRSLQLGDPAVRASLRPVTDFLHNYAEDLIAVHERDLAAPADSAALAERLEFLQIFFEDFLSKSQTARLGKAARERHGKLSKERQDKLDARMRVMIEALGGKAGRQPAPRTWGLKWPYLESSAKGPMLVGEFHGRQAAWEKVIELYHEQEATHVAVVKSEGAECSVFGSGGCSVSEGMADVLDIRGGLLTGPELPSKERPHHQLGYVEADEMVKLYLDAGIAKIVHGPRTPLSPFQKEKSVKGFKERMMAGLLSIKEFFWVSDAKE